MLSEAAASCFLCVQLVSLLPQDQFLVVVCGLLDSSVVAVQRKAMELLAARLKHLKDTSVKQQVKGVGVVCVYVTECDCVCVV